MQRCKLCNPALRTGEDHACTGEEDLSAVQQLFATSLRRSTERGPAPVYFNPTSRLKAKMTSDGRRNVLERLRFLGRMTWSELQLALTSSRAAPMPIDEYNCWAMAAKQQLSKAQEEGGIPLSTLADVVVRGVHGIVS